MMKAVVNVVFPFLLIVPYVGAYKYVSNFNSMREAIAKNKEMGVPMNFEFGLLGHRLTFGSSGDAAELMPTTRSPSPSQIST